MNIAPNHELPSANGSSPDSLKARTVPAAMEDNRREFLRGSIRYGVLAVIAAVVALLGSNNRRLGGPIACNRNFACSECPLVRGCDLPKPSTKQEARS